MTVNVRSVLSTFGKRPCAQCGEEIIAPMWSEYASAGHVRHSWNCEACGHRFESTEAFEVDSEVTLIPH